MEVLRKISWNVFLHSSHLDMIFILLACLSKTYMFSFWRIILMLDRSNSEFLSLTIVPTLSLDIFSKISLVQSFVLEIGLFVCLFV